MAPFDETLAIEATSRLADSLPCRPNSVPVRELIISLDYLSCPAGGITATTGPGRGGERGWHHDVGTFRHSRGHPSSTDVAVHS